MSLGKNHMRESGGDIFLRNHIFRVCQCRGHIYYLVVDPPVYGVHSVYHGRVLLLVSLFGEPPCYHAMLHFQVILYSVLDFGAVCGLHQDAGGIGEDI